MTEETQFDFSDFNALINDDVLKEIEDVSKPFDNSLLPENVYRMTVESLALVITKNNHPAVKCDLKVKAGAYTGKHLFYWMYLTSFDGKLHKFKVHLAHKFLNELTAGQIECKLGSDGFEPFSTRIKEVFEFAKKGEYDMKVSYTYPKNADGSLNKDKPFTNVEPIEYFVEE